jgi:hypothetical protein
MPGTRYTSRLEWHGPRVTRAAARGAAEGVNLALERLRALSVPLAPLDTGALRNSATIHEARELLAADPGGYLVFDTPYAAAQHERLDYQHDDGQAKYVEEPMLEHEAELLGLIARGIAHGIPRS